MMKTRVLLLGLSTFAEFLLNALHETGDAEIVAVDKDEETVNRIADRVQRPVIGNAANPDLLAELNVPDMDYVVVSMGSLESSVISVLYLKELGARQIVVKALNNEHVKVLELLGVHEIVFPERAVAKLTAVRLLHPIVINAMSFDSDQSIVEVKAPEAWIGQSVEELALEGTYGLGAVLVVDGATRQLTWPKAERIIEDGDALVLFGANARFEALEKSVPGVPSLKGRLAAGFFSGARHPR